MLLIGTLAFSFVVAPFAFAQTPAPPPDLASADWSVGAPHSLAKDPPANEAVWNFMIHFWGDAWIEQGKLCSFQFVDLRHSGELSLVTIYDWDGGGNCNDLTIFDKSPAGVEGFDYGGGPPLDDQVKDLLQDLSSDGHMELAVRSFDMTERENAWPSVYAWTGGDYTNVSSQYPRYYQDWLASTKKELASLESERESLAHATPAPSAGNGFVMAVPFHSGPGPAPSPSVFPMQPEQPEVAPDVEAVWRHEIDAKEAQVAKIERFLGSKDAGMLDAIRWANSDDPRERTLAAQVFTQMSTSEALRYEQTLSRDADPEVAKLASRKVKYWGEDDPYDAPAFVRVTPDHPRAF
ncbi:MAG: hypothetical protein IVW56_12495 [Candidatus Binataceae bacterium]|nr:hypothetical protein [Candidatus Binataceae bacterium]